MAEALKTFGAPWVLKLDGEEIQFPLLKMRQIATLQAVMVAERSAMAQKLAEQQKLKPDEGARMRMMVEREDVDIVTLRIWCQSPAGSVRTLEESLAGGDRSKEALAKADAVIDRLPVDEAVHAALRVTGWTPPPEEKSKAPANPSSADAR